MVKAVFLHDPGSIYDDTPWVKYEFPRMYLGTVEKTVGDWIIYYEPKKAFGGRGMLKYFAVARIDRVEPHPVTEGRYYAHVEPGSYLPLDVPVPRVFEGQVMESMPEAEPGRPIRAGANQLAVRRLTERDFERIVAAGLRDDPDDLLQVPSGRDEIDDPPAVFERPVTHQLLNRPFRDRAFRRQVLDAYGGRCAMSGLELRNGGGRPEVEAAHIKAVEEGGPDDVRNGLALSSTLHWMFDRGLVAVADDLTIVVSENKVPRDVQTRLLRPDRKLWVPSDPRLRPHPQFLAHHRESRFGGGPPGPDWRRS